MKDDPEEKVIGIDPDVVEWDLDVEAFDNIPNVKAVCTQSTSFDWVKPAELKKKNIVVCNAPYFSTDSVAEYAICLAMESAKRLPMHLKNNLKVDWSVTPMLLKGKTLGVIGLGHIGKRIAEIGAGIGMEVIFWSRKSKDERFIYTELPELFKTSDVVIPALVENEETKKIITKELLDTLKPTAIVVGINRIKKIFDEDYVIKLVEDGKIGGYVYEGDNVKELTAFKGNIWSVPPIAWYSQESIDNLMSIWLETICAAGRNKPINIVN